MKLFSLNLIIIFSSCSFGQTNEEILSSFYAAYNEHNTGKMLSYVSEEIKWLSISGDSVIVETSGKTELLLSMESYFKSIPSSRSEITDIFSIGTFTAVTEKAGWVNKNGTQMSQSALAVYEIKDGLINKVWYYYPGS